MAINPRRTKVFISYSRNDERWLKMLEPHLGSLARDRGIETWDDTNKARLDMARRDRHCDGLG